MTQRHAPRPTSSRRGLWLRLGPGFAPRVSSQPCTGTASPDPGNAPAPPPSPPRTHETHRARDRLRSRHHGGLTQTVPCGGPSRCAHVLVLHPPAGRAPVAAHPYQQCRRTPPERLVRQPPHHRDPRRALSATPSAEWVIYTCRDTALEHRPVGVCLINGSVALPALSHFRWSLRPDMRSVMIWRRAGCEAAGQDGVRRVVGADDRRRGGRGGVDRRHGTHEGQAGAVP